MSNLSFQIFDKAGNSLFGPALNNTLWADLGGACANENAGDPVVVYDQLADRWMLTQFSDTNAPFYNCVALSQTPDPTGAYYLWAFETPSFPDYPKYGVWPDGYYIVTRENTIGVYALNRAQMLAGNPTPQVVSFHVPQNFNAGNGLLPADLDGTTLPPAGSPEYFIGTMDDGGGLGAPQDALTLWEFDVDWATPGNSTFSQQATLPTAAFDSIFPCSPGSRDCIPQPGTTMKIDILSYRQRPTWRLAYRNFGTHESLVTNQSVEAVANMAGIRWYEVRSPNNSPFIFQQGTYAPGASDGIHRWMGSIAMDQDGNMALGYSASDATSTFPSVWYTGRLASDPLGSMPQGEESIIDGTGSQTGVQRWGDYTSMNVDPVDDCTFWYVNQYLPVTSPRGWQLRIGAFKFPSCGGASTNMAIVKTGDPAGYVLPGSALTYTLSASNLGPLGVITTTTTLSDVTGLVINDYPSGAATPYPGTLTLSGLKGKVGKATVTLYDYNHASPEDVNVLLVGPQGQSAMLMSDVGGNVEAGGLVLTFDDAAAGPMPDGNVTLISGTYQTSDYPDLFGDDNFPAPAPGGPYGTPLSVFNGTNPNGDWELYVYDDTAGEPGDISEGWSLTLELAQEALVSDQIPAGVTINNIAAPAGWNCTQAGQSISCTTDNLPVSASADILVETTVPAATGVIQNTANISSTLTEVDGANNSSTWSTIVDTPPIAVNDTYTTTEDTPKVVNAPGVMANDSDPDLDPMTASLATPPANGTASINANGAMGYIPDQDFNGSDQFTYFLSDGLITTTATVFINVVPVPDAPNAVGNAYTVQEDTPHTVMAPGVLGNDSDPDGDPLTAALQSSPIHGSLEFNADGSFVYTPTLNYVGSDSFIYIASDGALTDNATVSLNIIAVNDAPLASSDAYFTDEDTPLVVTGTGVLGNDTDVDSSNLNASVESGPTNGVLLLNADGSFIYTPALNFNGQDTFSYIVSDGVLTDSASVSIDVAAINDAPVAGSDAYATNEDTPLVIAAAGVLGNDEDVDGDALSAAVENAPANGALTLNADGSFTYTPDANFNGADQFSYLVSDGDLTDSATVTIDVTSINDAPLVSAGADQNVVEGDAVNFSGSFTDVGRSVLAIDALWDFGDGTTASGTLTPTHTYADNGSFIVTLTITDALGAAGSDTLVVQVDNAAPVLAALEDQTVLAGESFTVTGQFSDPGVLDTHTVVIEWETGVTETLQLAAGVTGFTANHAYTAAGTYTATATVTDKDGDSSTQTFVVTVESLPPTGSGLYLPFVHK